MRSRLSGQCKCRKREDDRVDGKSSLSLRTKRTGAKDLMVLTFTNKAANEIRERLENLTRKKRKICGLARFTVWHFGCYRRFFR